jgi:putative alpha-1,2-mannosidase
VLRENYLDTPDGIPGNDDCGAMSSWAVLSMMGIYSVDPASLAYELVGPTFPKVVIHLQQPYAGKTFAIESVGGAPNSPYIQSVQLNGQPHQNNWISFHSISDGGVLHFTLGSQPNHAWGAAAADAPPSLSDAN